MTYQTVVNEHGIFGFFGDYRWLSNFHVCNIEMDGLVYPSSEHAYMAQKTLDMEVRKTISELPTPAKARKFGQTVELRPDWDSFRVNAMGCVLYQKFRQNPELKEMLLATGDLYLEETNGWHDTFWGVCNGVGSNNLGNLLMIVRNFLRSEDAAQASNSA